MNRTPIEINDVKTWPADLLALLEKQESLLTNYLDRKNEILELRNSDYSKYLIAYNKFTAPRQAVLDQIESELKDSLFIGYHCTRITERESLDILRSGLEPSSKELYLRRINNLLIDGYISKDFFDILSTIELQAYTSDEIWLFFGKEDLKKESGVGDLLEYWGGEALYKSLGNKQSELRKIGKPSIILLVLDLIKITDEKNASQSKVANVIVCFYLLSKGFDSTDIGVEFYVNYFVKPENILKIINVEDSEFNLLTESASWIRKF